MSETGRHAGKVWPGRAAAFLTGIGGSVNRVSVLIGRGIVVYAALVGTVLCAAPAGAALVEATVNDFHLSGTQVGDVPPGVLSTSPSCAGCHGGFSLENSPYDTWQGSLMAHAGRDPLFYAQMTTANQDVANVGYYCMRCHVPLSFVTGNVVPTDGSALNDTDRDGVTCHFCHSMVDPLYKPGISPVEDVAILAGLAEVPAFYGNSMFVLDPTGTRRGPYATPAASHGWIQSAFHRSSDLCGTCHDVGNVAISKQPDGTYLYNSLDTPTPDEDPWQQFPLERTYTEWKLSAFAATGVDMGGRFGGDGVTVVDTCQSCHMPRTTSAGCNGGPVRSDLRRHDFAGAAAQVLDLIAKFTEDDPTVDQAAIARNRAKAVSMLERAASLSLGQTGATLNVRVTNESGHKLPTGHIEGRRVWLNVKFHGVAGLLTEHGHYDETEAELDTASTTVYEMKVGLSAFAALATGLPLGETTHMSLADTIVLDNRIPPRGFANATYEAGGAPVVGWTYADGQYWDDRPFTVPAIANRAEVTLYYQNTPRHYIETLRDGNVTDAWGDILHQAWVDTGRGAPIAMASATLPLTPPCNAPDDCDGDGVLPPSDCDNYDPTAYTGAPEQCGDLRDNDCDGATDEGDCALCSPALTVASTGQTRQTKARLSDDPARDEVLTRGVISLAAVGSIDPAATEVTVRVTDGGQNARYQVTIPIGGMVVKPNGRKFLYSDREKPYELGGLKSGLINVASDGLTAQYKFQARLLDLPGFTAGAASTVTVKIGDRCFVDSTDACESTNPRTVKCK